MRHAKQPKSQWPRAFMGGRLRMFEPAELPAKGQSAVDRIALVACLAGGGSGAVLILSQLFCL